ncbi:histone-lysine n-methyltransferase atxr3 [Hordeum vulgare]|nr:histone-lysine n-methyltransferase atxr3 [Hordeum vulgare]
MIDEEEVELTRRVMEDSVRTHDKAKWEGLEHMMSFSTAAATAIPELDAVVKEEPMQEENKHAPWRPTLVARSWSWTETISCVLEYLSMSPVWVGTNMRSPSLPREEVVQD